MEKGGEGNGRGWMFRDMRWTGVDTVTAVMEGRGRGRGIRWRWEEYESAKRK